MSSPLFAPFRHALDSLSVRYECTVAQGPELAKCLAVREQVFGVELRRDAPSGYSPAKQDEFDAVSTHLACRDTKTGEIIGAVRITPANHFKGHKLYDKEYALHEFPSDLLPRIAIVSRFAVLRDHRGKGHAGILLANECYRWGITQFVLSCIVCEPNLFPAYRELGFRPLAGALPSPFGGYRLPLFLVPHDYDFLKQVGSPFYSIAREQGFPKENAGRDWQLYFSLEEEDAVSGFSQVSETEAVEFHTSITQGLTDKGKKQLLSHAVKIDGKFKDVVLATGDGGKSLGFVKKGALEVNKGGRVQAVLGEGEIFGEVGFVLGTPRTANVTVASEKAEIVLLSLHAFEKLASEADLACAWKNLARILAQRLVSSGPA